MILAVVSAGVTSCSEDTYDDNTIEVTFNAALPAARAFGDASQVDSLIVGVLKKSGDDSYTEVLRKSSDLSTPVSFVLSKGQSYTFVFWAQNKDCKLYDTDDLTAISMASFSGDISFDDAEKSDAFYYVETIDDASKSVNKSVELARLLAQVNVGTTGKSASAKLEVTGLPHTFNPITGAVSGTADYVWNFKAATTETFTVDGVEYKYLAVAYMFAPKGSAGDYAAKLTVEESTTLELQVQLQSNNKCNIIGAITDSE